MSRRRTLAETDANVARIKILKKPKTANKSKESSVRVLYSFVELIPVLAVVYKCPKAVPKVAAALLARTIRSVLPLGVLCFIGRMVCEVDMSFPSLAKSPFLDAGPIAPKTGPCSPTIT